MNNIISLGYNCFIKKYLDYKYVKTETSFFDYIGTSMWTINELINNDFKDLFDINDYKLLKILNKYTVVNKKYYIRVPHCLDNNLKNFNIFKDKYERRIIRLQTQLKENKKILFIRLEENMLNREIYPEYKDKFKKTELEYIYEFCDLMKIKYPKLEIKFIYISKNHETKIDNNIIILKNNYDFEYSNCIEYLDKILKNYI